MQDKSEFFDADELDAVSSAQEAYADRKQTQREFLDALGEENEPERIQTPVELAQGVTATVEVELTGAFLDRLAELSELTDGTEEESLSDLPTVARSICNLLADVTTDPSLTSTFFYTQVYRDFEPGILLEMLENVIDNVESERERERGRADGFRGE